MKLRLFSAIVLSLALTAAASAQNEPTAAPTNTPTGQSSDAGAGGLQGQDRDQGQRGGRGGFGMGMGRGVLGTVTEVAADHYAIKTDAGETYIVHFSVNTRILRQSASAGARERKAATLRSPSSPLTSR